MAYIMPCYHPLTAFYKHSPNPKTGLRGIVFNSSNGSEALKIPCGQCIGCRLEKSRQWAIRLTLEQQTSDNAKFLTLTYNNQSLINNPKQTLNKSDIILFLKKLRKKLSKQQIQIRYYQCGEYGTLNNRPHHHAIIFFNGKNVPEHLFGDEEILFNQDGQQLYKSEILNKIWGLGYTTIGNVTFDSCAYVARYVTKKITGAKADHHYQGKQPEYATMSRRPGIGREWYDKFKMDVRNTDKIITRELTMQPPKYYDVIHKAEDPEGFEKLKQERIAKVNLSEQTFARLQVKERNQIRKLKPIQRKFENGTQDFCD